jgi:hypothetical protein
LVKRRAESQYRKQFSGLHREIVAYLEGRAASGNISREEIEILTYIKTNFLSVFPYEFARKYEQKDIEVHFDRSVQLHYVDWNGKKLYWKKDFSVFDIKRAVKALLIEQDPASPHRYLTSGFSLKENGVIVDVGAAEGIFSLDAVEHAKKIYVIEADPSWEKALEATFSPWKHKVDLIFKFGSDKSDNSSIALNDIYRKEGRIDFIKIDVEGAETKVLAGASEVVKMANDNLQIVVCTYHKQTDADTLSNLLKSLGCRSSFSDGYMFFIYDNDQVPPYLRKGLIRANK